MANVAKKRKVKKNVPVGVAHIHSTFNNTIVTICDPQGNAKSLLHLQLVWLLKLLVKLL